jgi:single-strand DNA-binding protein
MSNDLNRCEFIGRLGRDVETRYSPSGDAISNFTLAVGWKTKDKEGVEWVSVVAFGKLAEICGEYLTKGKQVYVSGRINTQKYKDKETGQDRYSTRIVADQMQMLGGRDDGQAPAQQRTAASQSSTSDYQRAREGTAPQQEASKPNFSDMDDDIPF